MYSILQDPDSGLNSNAQDIPLVLKYPTFLSGTRYHKQLVDENGQSLYPTNLNMKISIHNLRSSLVIRCELDLFYDTPMVKFFQNVKD